MIKREKRHIKLWIALGMAVIFWTAGAGFYRDLSASNEETYKGLKIFSDVIDLIENRVLGLIIERSDLVNELIDLPAVLEKNVGQKEHEEKVQ